MGKKARVETVRRSIVYVMALIALVTAVIGLKGPVTENMEKRKERREAEEEKRDEQMKFNKDVMISRLARIGVVVTEYTYDSYERKEKIYDGEYIYSDKLELQLSLYSSFLASYINKNKAPEMNDIKKIFLHNNMKPAERLLQFCLWAELTKDYIQNYEDALRTAKLVYDEEYGLYKGKLHYGELTGKERIELAKIVRNNPEFMPEDIFFEELKNLEPLRYEEFERLLLEWKREMAEF